MPSQQRIDIGANEPAILAAASKLWDASGKPLFATPLPDIKTPSFSSLFHTPGQYVKDLGSAYGAHAKRLTNPSNLGRALVDFSPRSIAMQFLIPEALGSGPVSKFLKTPPEERGEYIGGQLGRLVGGQLTGRVGILANILGTLAGGFAGGQLGRIVDRLRRPSVPPTEPQALAPADDAGSNYPGTLDVEQDTKQGSSFGDPGPLPVVAGSSPMLSAGGPGDDAVKGKGRFTNRNDSYRNTDGFRTMVSPDLNSVYYGGNGRGAGGGQQYADGDLYRHSGILNGVLKRLNKDTSDLSELPQ